MKGRAIASIPAAVLGLAVLAGVAMADTTIVTKTNDATQTIQIAQQKLRVGSADGGMIFRGDMKLLWILDAEKKTATEITQADMEELGRLVNNAAVQMRNLPKAVADNVRKNLPGTELPQQTVTPLGKSKEIHGFPCAGYKVTVEGDDHVTEVWTTEPTAVQLAPADLTVFKQLASFLTFSMPAMGDLLAWAKDVEHPKPGQIPGIPILTIVKDSAGAETLRTEVVSVEHPTIEAGVFDLPAGYAKGSMKGKK
jgi:hypothetical protein